MPCRLGSPSMRYTGAGCTTARADHGAPPTPGMELTTCGAFAAPGQYGHSPGGTASGASPVSTHERVIGSLRSSMALEQSLQFTVHSSQSARHLRSPGAKSWQLAAPSITIGKRFSHARRSSHAADFRRLRLL